MDYFFEVHSLSLFKFLKFKPKLIYIINNNYILKGCHLAQILQNGNCMNNKMQIIARFAFDYGNQR